MKRLLTIILAMTITISFAIPSRAEARILKDLEDSKYKLEIEKLIEDGTISGYEDKTFRPQNGITRGELAKILVVTLNLEEDKKSAEHFIDVNGKWNQGFVGALYKAKIMIGTGSNKFGQNNNVTKEELAVVLLRIFELEKIANDLALDIGFKDSATISLWATNAVAFVNKIGLMSGVENKDGSFSFSPKGFGERELVAKLVYELKYNRDVYEKVIITIKEAAKTEKPKDETNTATNPSGEKPTENKPSYDSIVSKYQSQLSALEDDLDSQVSSLISSAMTEYKKGVPVSEILSKYMGMASSLESSSDSQVSSILSSLSSELITNGYDTAIIAEFQAQYESAKEEAKGNIQLP